MMALRDDMIMEKAALEAELADRSDEDGFFKRRRRRHGKRTRLGYKVRMALFVLLVGLALLSYVISYVRGGTWGAAANAWTDSLIINGIDFLTNHFAAISGVLAHRSESISRILTVGPLSYILFCSVVAAAVVGLFALVYSLYKTRRAIDNGTSNFVSEQAPARKKRSGSVRRRNPNIETAFSTAGTSRTNKNAEHPLDKAEEKDPAAKNSEQAENNKDTHHKSTTSKPAGKRGWRPAGTASQSKPPILNVKALRERTAKNESNDDQKPGKA